MSVSNQTKQVVKVFDVNIEQYSDEIKFKPSFDRIPMPVKSQNYVAVYGTLPGQLVDEKSNLAVELI